MRTLRRIRPAAEKRVEATASLEPDNALATCPSLLDARSVMEFRFGDDVPQPTSKRDRSDDDGFCRVRFGPDTVNEVPSWSDDKTLWWTKEELATIRAKNRRACRRDEQVRYYLQSYETFYSNFGELMEGNEFLLTTFKKILANGLFHGYQGLERASSFEFFRQHERKQIICRILSAYRSAPDREEVLRSISTSLTRKMTLWAACVGEAGHLAVC